MTATYSCHWCGGKIAFERSEFYTLHRTALQRIGPEINCPHCHKTTTVTLPDYRWLWATYGLLAVGVAVMWISFPDVTFRWLFGADSWQGYLRNLLLLAALVLYFLPAIVGARKRNATAITVLNFFLGWTLLGWVVALVWACTHDVQTLERNAQERSAGN